MNRFVPREKLSKKAKHELDASRRISWGVLNPVTRKAENKKAYRRKKSLDRYDEYGRDFFIA